MRKIFVCCMLFLFAQAGYALAQYEKLWLGASMQASLTADKKWLGFLYSQLRTINESHPVQAGLIEAGAGYQIHADYSLWAGYRWTGHQPYNDFYQENRLFQQLLWLKRQEQIYWIIRSRLEEIKLSNQSPVVFRLRERFALEINKQIWKFFPFYYDEIFLQLNQTAFTPHHFLGENRLFLGFNLYTGEKRWWEVGYINQYRYGSALSSENQMSHILSLTYNIM